MSGGASPHPSPVNSRAGTLPLHRGGKKKPQCSHTHTHTRTHAQGGPAASLSHQWPTDSAIRDDWLGGHPAPTLGGAHRGSSHCWAWLAHSHPEPPSWPPGARPSWHGILLANVS